MTIEDKETVLKYILDTCSKKHDTFFCPHPDYYNDFKNMPFPDEVLRALESDGLLKDPFNSKTDQIVAFEILPKGLLYFDTQKRNKIEFWKRFAISHIVNLIVSAIVALITALITIALVK